MAECVLFALGSGRRVWKRMGEVILCKAVLATASSLWWNDSISQGFPSAGSLSLGPVPLELTGALGAGHSFHFKHFCEVGKVWNTTFGTFLSCYNFVPNEIWQHNSCSNYSNWLQRVQDDHVISCFMGERSPPSPYFHASVVFKGVLQRTVKQSTTTWVLNTVLKGWLVTLETNSNRHKKKNHIAFFPS